MHRRRGDPLRFPGWTFRVILGAGAAQTMANVQRVLPGKRILMIGSGNVGVIVAYQLLQAGADVVGIVEGMPKIGAYGVHAAKIRRAGIPFYLGSTIAEAKGTDHVEKAVIAKFENGQIVKGTEMETDVDVICVAVGLRPLSELHRWQEYSMISFRRWADGCRFTTRIWRRACRESTLPEIRRGAGRGQHSDG